MRIFLIFVLALLVSGLNGQDIIPTYQSNTSLNFSDFLSGVRHAYITLEDKDIKFINDNPTSANAFAIIGLISYLKEIGFEEVRWGYSKDSQNDYPSICDQVIVIPSWGFQNYTFTNITLSFISCKAEIFTFESNRNIRITGLTRDGTFHNAFLKIYGNKKGPYSLDNRRYLTSEITEWSEEKLKSHFKDNGIDPIEGIYESTDANSLSPKYKIGIIKTDFGYNVIYYGGANNYEDWKSGEIKAKLYSTATQTLYKAEWYMASKQVNKDAYVTFDQGLMNLVLKDSDKTLYIKLFPSSRDNISSNVSRLTSGSGFAITSDGLIATNHHVVTQSKSIKVKGINGDFDKSYNAKIIIEDKNNDLAILKIDDPNFTDLGIVPYIINSKTADVGSSIFVLGYPLRSSMGDEIKLTNGVISSKSGFQGDVTSYQISAPIQPGNSGGPLFDEKGNLVGVINAKHSKAENASYAIKASYLLSLFELMNTYPKLQTNSDISGKPLTEQVKILKKFTYIIETTN